jgi:hypothetical protein
MSCFECFKLIYAILQLIYLLKIVIPASICFWFIGYFMGRILDSNKGFSLAKQEFKLTDNEEAYTIPSMFSTEDANIDNSQVDEI